MRPRGRAMKNYKGFRLYIALGPSQVRRRLKGHGFGVKTVQSAGRNMAVIVHTATGDHLEQLKKLFADVSVAQTEAEISVSRAKQDPTAIELDPHNPAGQELRTATRADHQRG